MGASLLNCVGLGDLVAATAEDYVGIARRLAQNLAELERLRSGMRQRLSASPLCDETTFTRRLETAFRTMWQRWCVQ